MKGIQECFERKVRPIRVLQFGEGNFLRAFADWMIDILNEQGKFDGGIAIAKPIPMGDLSRFEIRKPRENGLKSARDVREGKRRNDRSDRRKNDHEFRGSRKNNDRGSTRRDRKK